MLVSVDILGCDMKDTTLCEHAAGGGQLHCLEYLHKNGYPMSGLFSFITVNLAH